MSNDFFDPFNFGEMRRRQEEDCKLARKAKCGLLFEHIVPGALVTISTNKATGDRSYTDDILEVLASNNGSIVCKATGLCGFDRRGRSFVIQYHEHEFYSAEALADAIRASNTTPA